MTATIYMSIPLYLSAVYILATRNCLHAVLALICGLLDAAILLLMNNCEFIAMIFLVVYIGAICVLFLFVIMLLNLRSYQQTAWNKAKALVLMFILFIFTCFFFICTPGPTHTTLSIEANPMTFGLEYFIQEDSLLILLTLLLILAILGPVLISNKHTVPDFGKLQEQYYALTRGANTRVFILSSSFYCDDVNFDYFPPHDYFIIPAVLLMLFILFIGLDFPLKIYRLVYTDEFNHLSIVGGFKAMLKEIQRMLACMFPSSKCCLPISDDEKPRRCPVRDWWEQYWGIIVPKLPMPKPMPMPKRPL